MYTAEHARRDRRAVDAVHNETLRILVMECLNLVKVMAQQKSATSCVWQIPLMKLGYALYDQEKMCKRVIGRLRKRDFQVEELTSHCIRISWRK